MTPPHKRCLRAALLLFGLTLLSWSFFGWIPGKNVVLAADVLRLVPPWTRPGPPPRNIVLTDSLWVFYPWLRELRQALLSGRFPLWDPTILCGIPIAANPTSAFFFPLSWLVLPFGAEAGISALAVLRPALAGWFLFLYLRRRGSSRPASLFGAITYAFCLPFLVWAEHPHDNVFLLAPLLLLTIDRCAEDPSWRKSAGVACVTALVLLGGHPESAFHLLCLAAAYSFAAGPATAESPRPRILAAIGLGVAWGASMALFALYPFARVILASSAFQQTGHLAFALPGRAAVAMVFPHFFAHPFPQALTPDAPGNLNESAIYFGLAPLVLVPLAALTARRSARRDPPPAFWVGVLIVCAVLIFLGPLWSGFSRLPLIGKIYHNRLTVLAGLAIAVLSAAAVDSLPGLASRPRSLWAAWAGAAGMAALLPVVLAGRPPAEDEILGAALVLFALAAGLWLVARRPRMSLVLFCGIQFADLWQAGAGFHPISPAEEVYPPAPAIAEIRRSAGSGRILGVGRTLPPDSATVLGLQDVRGYDSVERSAYRTARSDLAVWTANASLPETTAVAFSPRSPDLLRLFGVRVVVFPGDRRPSAPLASALGLQAIGRTDDSGCAIYAVKNSPGRFQAVGAILPGDGSEVSDEPFRSAQVTGILRPAEFQGASGAEVTVLRDEPERLEIATRSRGEFFLRISDSFDPGWRAQLDGVDVRIYPTDAAFRGVFIPAGLHRLRLRYRLPGLPATAPISVLAALAAAVILARRSSGRPV